FQILASKEYGASYALLELAKELGLDRALYSRKEAWVQDCLAMIVGRIVYAGSKLALSNQWKNTALWELSGVEGKVDVDLHCYLPMDRLLERKSAIQRTLAARHLQDGHLVLYDITSSYFEGAYTQSDIVTFGYNRDGKRGHEQMVIALLAARRVVRSGSKFFPVTLRTEMLQLCRLPVVGWPDAPPGLFRLLSIQMASIRAGGHPHGSGM